MGATGSALLLSAAASLAVVHTAIGIDHALPFVVLSRVQGWTLRRTLWVTALCGLGHVASALVLGLGALALGVAVERLVAVETLRGHLALGVLVSFGLGYAALGALRFWRYRPHHPAHPHLDERKRAVTVWTLFVVLVFGPCEALVPLLLAPGLMQDTPLLMGVIAVFGGLTVLTMLVLVTVGVLGARLVELERFLGNRAASVAEVMAGLTIAATGAGVALLGL